MKHISVLITCLLAWGITFAQNKPKITGKITDEKGSPIAYAITKLINSADTLSVIAIQTDTAGQFVFEPAKSGEYVLKVQMIGYQAKEITKFKFDGDDVNLPILKLTTQTKNLKEITIQGKKPFIERKIDKVVLNVEGSVAASGNSVLEVLEKAPGVTIDRQSEQIKLNNKSGITVMIDGKTNFLSGSDITTLLSNMNSDQVASIELITNPSSKYDAAGAAGIINIKLKRNKAFGTNGSLSLNTGKAMQPNLPTDTYRAGLMLNLNHRVERWNIFGTTAFNRKVNINAINAKRSTQNGALQSLFDQNFNRNTTGIAYMGKLGADFYASEKTVFGLMIDANAIHSNTNNDSKMLIREIQSNTQTTNAVNQFAASKSPLNNLTANFNVKHDFDKEGKSLTFDADFSRFGNSRDERFDASYFNQFGTQTNATALRNDADANINIMALKADYTLPIEKTIKMEMGLKSSYVVTKNILSAEQLIAGAWQNDAGKSNHFIYKENINAAYTNFAKEWSKWQIQLGLRAEHTHSNGNSVTLNNQVDRQYLSLFPTFFLNQTLSKNSNLNYSFSRRVDRPNYQQLNPFVFYMDPYALDEGNPYLKPQFTYNFEVGYTYKEIGLSLSYSDTRDLITQISQQNEVTRVINVIRKNLGRAQNYSANLFFPVNVGKHWKMQHNFVLFYNRFNDENLEGSAYAANRLALNININQSFILPKNFLAEVNFWYNSPRVQGVEQTTINQFALGLGIQKTLMNKRLKLRAGVDDLFLTNHWEGKLQYQNVNLQVVNNYLSRRVNFSLNYNFGNQNVKSARKRNSATDDIKNRAGGN